MYQLLQLQALSHIHNIHKYQNQGEECPDMLGNEQQLDEDIKPKQGVRPGVLSCSFLIPAKSV
ncbi:hypothetical protein BDV09DRAFT_174887 [Aspergillus tetrazonus]